MSRPFGNVDTTFESFLQELPEDYRALALDFKAFCRSREIKTPERWMQVVMCYCGIALRDRYPVVPSDSVIWDITGRCSPDDA